MLSRLKRLFLDEPDEYVLIRLGPGDRELVDRLDEELGPMEAEFQHDLRPAVYRLQAVRGGRFAEVAWREEVGDVERARELEDVRSELRALQAALEDDGAQSVPEDFGQQLERGILTSVLEGQIGVDEARSLADLHARFEGRGGEGGELGEPSVSFSIDSPQQLAIYKALTDPDGTISTLRRATDEVLGGAERDGGADRDDGAGGSSILEKAIKAGGRDRARDKEPDDDEGPPPKGSSERLEAGVAGMEERGLLDDEAADVDEPAPGEPAITEEEADAIVDELEEEFGADWTADPETIKERNEA